MGAYPAETPGLPKGLSDSPIDCKINRCLYRPKLVWPSNAMNQSMDNAMNRCWYILSQLYVYFVTTVRPSLVGAKPGNVEL